MKGARIGERSVIGQNVNVDGGTVIGNNVKIQNNVSVYTGTVIEDDVFLGPSCVLTNVSNPRSQVNRHSLVRNHASQAGLHCRREFHDRVRSNRRTICIRGRRFGGHQERARLRSRGRKSGAPSGLDESPRASARRARFRRM